MSLENKRIYIVEDNTDNIYVISSVLRKHKAVVIIDWWAKGDQAKIVENLPLDLIILDLMLPDRRSGFDIFDELRQFAELDNVPIIAVSAMDTSVAVPQAIEKGFSGFIAKPIDYDLFPKQIESIIAGNPIWNDD